jgi:hypothetical protein
VDNAAVEEGSGMPNQGTGTEAVSEIRLLSGTLQYRLNMDAHLKMEAYDVRGNKLRTLINGGQGAGRHQIHNAFAGLASGVVILKMTAENSTQIKKGIILW